MCTSPNYLVNSGKHDGVKIGRLNGKEIFEFIGKVPYDKLNKLNNNWIAVPCGQCLECRIQQARSWADRIILESKKYEHNYFVTLTYAPEYMPLNMSLVPDDLSLFIRYLRRKFPDSKIRFFGCGEYGDTTRRPHYHLILFNCPLDDLTVNFKEWDFKNKRYINHLRPNNAGNLKYSQTIMDAWVHKGIISVGDLTYDSAAYVASYVTKKFKPGLKEIYDKLGIEPEFVRMSTHPGIANEYYQDKKDYLLFDGKMIVPSSGEAHISMTPRYFDKLFIKDFGEEVFDHIRHERISHRLNKRLYDDSSGVNLDIDNFHRDYRSKKRQRLRESI